jgi:conjugative relaxase-like TrwC/TraI family protein
MLIGQIYRNELALQVKQLGYQLKADYRQGLFEIKGVPETLTKRFSKL